jgi:protein FRA10AC1
MSTNKDHRKSRAVITQADEVELERHYQFVPESTVDTWQGRMVKHYHQHLYKEYVLADMQHVSERKLGLRWRTKQEVANGKGSRTCGNKHCPSHTTTPQSLEQKLHASLEATPVVSKREQKERNRLIKLNYGDGQTDFEVPFSYQENNTSKMELVKLRLCAKCAPLLFIANDEVNPCRAACGNDQSDTDELSSRSSLGSSAKDQKECKRRKRHKNKRSKRRRKSDDH